MTDESLPLSSPIPNVDQKLRSVLTAMAEAVTEMLATESSDSFGRAARLCVMGQKISIDLVKTVAEAKKASAQDLQGQAVMGLMGPEAQYIGQGGGDILGYAEDQNDYAILNPQPRYVGPQMALPDGVQLQRDLLAMLGAHLESQKKAMEPPAPQAFAAIPQSRVSLYFEMNELLRTRSLLSAPEDAALLARVNEQIETYVDLIAQKDPSDVTPPSDSHVVSAELLRGHPPRAGEQWGDACGLGGPFLHREDGGEGAHRGGEADRDHEEALGA